KKERCRDATARYTAPSPQQGTRLRASSAARRKAARSRGDSGPARREISCSTSSEMVMDMGRPRWDKLAVSRSLFFCFRENSARRTWGPFLYRPDLDFHATDG